MFLRRRKPAGAKQVPAGLPVPGHFGDIWHLLQAIAREEDPRFEEKSVVEHFNSSAEAHRDVQRWLNIYQRRLDPDHRFELPPHHPRYRGFVLVERNWPPGVLWDAFDEKTWRRASVSGTRDRESLERGIDEMLEESGQT